MPVPRTLSTSIDIDVVLAGLYINASADLRRLSMLGYAMLGITDDAREPGLKSRHGLKLICPNPGTEFDAWVAFMEDLGRHCKRPPVLIPTSDDYVLALDRAADRLKGAFRFHGFGDGLRTALTSKRRTFELAEKHGFPAPVTRFVGSRDDVLRFADVVQGEALIKPEYSPLWRTWEALAELGPIKVLTARSANELIAIYDRVSRFSPNVVVQEVIPGPDENLIYWAGLVTADGVGGRIVGRKTRVTPIHFGSASFVELLDMPQVEEQCAKFLMALGYRGRCGIELKIDPRDGVAKLIEVNPRTGLWENLGLPAGVDLAAEEVAAVNGEKIPPKRAARFDVKWVHVGRDVDAYVQYHAEGTLSFRKWMGALRGGALVVTDMPFFDDFPYAWKNLTSLVRMSSRRAGHELGRRLRRPGGRRVDDFGGPPGSTGRPVKTEGAARVASEAEKAKGQKPATATRAVKTKSSSQVDERPNSQKRDKKSQAKPRGETNS